MRAPRRPLILTTLIALVASTLAMFVAAAPPAAAAYADEHAWACHADEQPWGSGVLTDYSINYPGECGAHSMARLGQPDAIAYYGQFGFDKNFMLWAPEQRLDVSERYFGGCTVRQPNHNQFCPGGPANVAYNYQVKADWNGLSTVKSWGRGFISVRCGNHSRPIDGIDAGPVPTISGTKYEDVNGNGQRDAGEPPLSGVTIRLSYGGQVVDTRVTDGNGRYAFPVDTVAKPQLGVGTYSLSEVVEPGYRQTAAPAPLYLDYGIADRAFTGNDFGNQRETDVAITKSTPTPVTIAGLETTWHLDVVNNGPWVAPDVVVTDDVDPVRFASVTGVPSVCTLTGFAIRCELGSLAVGVPRRLTFTARTRYDLMKDLVVPNTARVTTSMRDPVPANNQSTAVTTIDTRADLSLTKVASTTYVDGGDEVVWTMRVTNDGPSSARAVRLLDPVPYDVQITSVTPTDTCGVVGQDVTCTWPVLHPGESRTVVVTSRMRGTPIPPDDPSHGDHLLGFDKVDTSWDLDPGQTKTVAVGTCPQGGIVTDVSHVVSSVDSGTGGPQDVEVRASRTVGLSTGELVLRNHATGRAQGHASLTCLRPTTVSGDDHRHDVGHGPVVTRTATLSPGTNVVTIDVGLDQYAVAPSWTVTNGHARLVSSERTDTGWALGFWTDQAGTAVTASVLPVDRRLRAAGDPTHAHDTVWEHVVRTIDVPTGRSSHTVTCPSLSKGVTATFDLPVGVTVGHEPQPVSRVFTLDNAGHPTTGVVDLVCLRERTGPIGDAQRFVTNTATVSSATVDPDPSDNSASATVVIRRALGSVVPTTAPPAPAPRVSRFVARGAVVSGAVACSTTCRAVVRLQRGREVLSRTTVTLRDGKARIVRLRGAHQARGRLTVVVKVGRRVERTTVRRR